MAFYPGGKGALAGNELAVGVAGGEEDDRG